MLIDEAWLMENESVVLEDAIYSKAIMDHLDVRLIESRGSSSFTVLLTTSQG